MIRINLQNINSNKSWQLNVRQLSFWTAAIVFVLFSSVVVAGEVRDVDVSLTREYLRQEFKKARSVSKTADQLVARLSQYEAQWRNKESAVVVVYYGALKGLQAKYSGNPAKKIKYLRESLSWLDRAVSLDSMDLEVHFVRFATLHYLPAFLGIGKKRYEDIQDIIRLLLLKDFSRVDRVTQKEMIDFMVGSRRLTAAQKKAMEKLRLEF
jgi:hypothetical protein